MAIRILVVTLLVVGVAVLLYRAYRRRRGARAPR